MLEKALVGAAAGGLLVIVLLVAGRLSRRSALVVCISLVLGTALVDMLTSRGPSRDPEPALGTKFSLRDEDWYQSCLEDAARHAPAREGFYALRDACEDKAVPKACRGLSATDGYFEVSTPGTGGIVSIDLFSASRRERGERSFLAKCAARCAGATYLSRTLGACSKG